MPKGVYIRSPRGPRSPETIEKIRASLKGNKNLQDAMRRVHKRRIMDGSDQFIRDKIRETRTANGDWIVDTSSAFHKYKREVRGVTSRQPIHKLENADQRGQGKYHLDHLVSKKTGFELRFPPEFIGDISNLQFIPENQNCSKAGRNTMEEITSLWFHLSEELDFYAEETSNN